LLKGRSHHPPFVKRIEGDFSRQGPGGKMKPKLYEIPEARIAKLLKGKELIQGNQEIIENLKGNKVSIEGCGYGSPNRQENRLKRSDYH
jgi:hypothetical protein